MRIEQIYTKLVAEHSKSKRNKHHIESPTTALKGVNPNCGDEIELELREKEGVIEDAAFTGIGCAISQASASVMIDLIKGKTTDEALKLAETFLGMIQNKITDEEQLKVLDAAVAFRDISHMPARVKCAVLSWNTLENALEGKANELISNRVGSGTNINSAAK
jgi:SUF system FeS assembly protein, NifU family